MTMESATEFLKSKIAEALKKTPADINEHMKFTSLGLDSLDAMRIFVDIQKEVGKPLRPTLMFEFETICDVAAYLETV
jgi:acyl carrier protein